MKGIIMSCTNILTPITKILSVLVIESEYKISEKFFDYLTNYFKSVTFENNENLILEHFKNTTPDVLIIDLETKGINLFSIVKKMRETNPNLPVIVFTQKEDYETLVKCIKNNITAVLKKTADLIHLKKEIINIIENYTLNETLNDNSDIDVFSSLQYIMDNEHSEISLVNHYKGVPIIKKGKILNIENNKLTISVESINKYTLEHLKHTVFTSIHLGKEIYANLHSLDKENGIAIFEDLKLIDSYIHHRKFPRVQPCENIAIILEINQKHYKIPVIDFSLNYILFNTNILPDSIDVNDEVKIHINLNHTVTNLSGFDKQSFTCNAIIDEIFCINDTYKVLVHFDLENDLENLLKIYINKRSTELIKEFKSLFY